MTLVFEVNSVLDVILVVGDSGFWPEFFFFCDVIRPSDPAC